MAVEEHRVSKPVRTVRGSRSEALRRASMRAARVALGVIAVAACTSAPRPADPHPGAAEPAAPRPGATLPGYDWHAFSIVPFGTLLKESPVPLHEVLLFHEAARGAPDNDIKDCYALDAVPPRLLGRDTDEYLLCFEHDRLARIDASVRLAVDEAAAVFARACAVWQKSAAAAPEDGRCEGRDGAVTFRAHLTTLPDEPAAVLALTLTNGPENTAAQAPAP